MPTWTGNSDVRELPPIPVVCGPTGSGKTSLVVALAAQFPLEVVSADSRQIIRHLDIGTAKPTPEEQRAVRFHLVDIVEPGERYSAYQFVLDCDAAIDDILSRRNIPVLVGGTGLYLRALTEGVIEFENPDPGARCLLEEEMRRKGPEAMHRRLAEVDPEEASRIHAHNQVRVIRALEIYELTGFSKSELTRSGTYKRSKHSYEFLCLQQEREILYDRINRRVDQMLAQGLLAEVGRLVSEGLEHRLRRANVIGYEELLDYLKGRMTLSEAIDLIKRNSRRYAKRQITWFRHQARCSYYADADQLDRFLQSELKNFGDALKP